MDREKINKSKEDEQLSAKDIINKAISDAKVMRISMGTAVVNKMSNDSIILSILSFILFISFRCIEIGLHFYKK